MFERLKKFGSMFRFRRELRMLVSSQIDILERNSLFALGGLTQQEETFLVALLGACRTDGPIVEFGTLFGLTARLFAQHSGGRRVIAVDNFCWNPFGLTSGLHREFTRRCLLGSNIELVDSDSRSFRNAYVAPPPALVFLDADHSYVAVREEILWARSVGAEIISGHDYGNPAFGVTQAVDEFFPSVKVGGMIWAAGTGPGSV